MAHPKSTYNSFWALGRSPWSLLIEFLSRDQWMSFHSHTTGTSKASRIDPHDVTGIKVLTLQTVVICGKHLVLLKF